jgi:hypothetical protein
MFGKINRRAFKNYRGYIKEDCETCGGEGVVNTRDVARFNVRLMEIEHDTESEDCPDCYGDAREDYICAMIEKGEAEREDRLAGLL